MTRPRVAPRARAPDVPPAPAPGTEAAAADLPPTNAAIATRLEEVAELLEAQGANRFRVRAYRDGARVVRALQRPAAEIAAAEGTAGLRSLPHVGAALARAIEQLALTGRYTLLERLRGDAGPREVLTTVPGLGAELARRIYEQLGIDDLYELEIAAYDGRLRRVPGMGPGRVRMVRESLAGRFRRRPWEPAAARGVHAAAEAPRRSTSGDPSVAELLDVDAEYRRKAAADRLPRIAPRRFNPSGEAWLPILHTRRRGRHYTALYSNTARAHELGTTRDWVVVYREDHGGRGQWTVITARLGELHGQRIVRGREAECSAHYGSPADGSIEA